MRAFFGIAFEPGLQVDVDAWRRQNLPDFVRPVLAENFHLTLAFLGDVSGRQLHVLVERAGLVRCNRFELTLDQVGYWPKREIAYLGPSVVPDQLLSLVDQTRQLVRRSGLRVERRAYKPHVTMARRCQTAPPPPLKPADFELRATEVHLFESTRHPAGVVYEIVETFPLY